MKTEMIIKPKPKLRWMRCTLVENYDLTVRFSGSKEDWSESEFILGTPTRVLLDSIREQMEKIMIAHTKREESVMDNDKKLDYEQLWTCLKSHVSVRFPVEFSAAVLKDMKEMEQLMQTPDTSTIAFANTLRPEGDQTTLKETGLENQRKAKAILDGFKVLPTMIDGKLVMPHISTPDEYMEEDNTDAIEVLDEFQKGDEQEQKETFKEIEHHTKPKMRWMRCTLENDDLTVRFSGRKEDWSESEFISGTQTRVLLNSIREQMEKIMIAHTKSI